MRGHINDPQVASIRVTALSSVLAGFCDYLCGDELRCKGKVRTVNLTKGDDVMSVAVCDVSLAEMRAAGWEETPR